MRKKEPFVSVLICCYNAEKFIAQTLKSILDKNYRNMEVLSLDNSSDDDTLKILRSNKRSNEKRQIRIFHSDKNLGPYKGLNFLLDKTEGDYISIADHDDIYHPDKIKKQINFLLKNKKYVGCGTCAYKYFEKNKNFKYVKVSSKGFFSLHPSLIFKKSKGLKYETNVRYKTDTFFMRYILCKDKRLLFNIQEPLYLIRVREDGNNLSSSWNRNLSFSDIMNYYDFAKDKNTLLKYLFKKIFKYNFIIKILDSFGRKNLGYFEKDRFLVKYVKYLKN